MEHQHAPKPGQFRPETPAAAAVKPVSVLRHPFNLLHQRIGNQAIGRFLQAKLSVNAPGDVYEQEADRVADAVIEMPASAPGFAADGSPSPVQRKCAASASGESLCPDCAAEKQFAQRKPRAGEISSFVQRQQAEEDEEDRVQARPISGLAIQRDASEKEDEQIQTKASSGMAASRQGGTALVNRIDNIRHGGGQPLPAPARAFFESRFGRDFDEVRVHTDAAAAATAQAINARAYTLGNHVVFGAGQYAPGTIEGKRLLSHELTHVVQQTGQRFQPSHTLQRAVQFNANFDNIALRPNPAAAIAGDDFTFEDAEFSADAQISAIGDSVAELNQWDVGILQDMTVNWEREYWRRDNTDRRGRFVEQKYRPINTRFRDQEDGATTVWSADSEHQLLSALPAVPVGSKFRVSTTIQTADFPGGSDAIHGSSVAGMDASDGTRNINIQRIGTRFDTWISAHNTTTDTWRHLRRLNWNYQRSLDFAGRGATLAVGTETAQIGRYGPLAAGGHAPLVDGATANAAVNDDANWLRRRVNGWT